MLTRSRLLLLMALLMSVWARGWTQTTPTCNAIECGLCIQQAGCAWCFAETFMGSLRLRCQPEDNFTVSCPPSSRANPRSSFVSSVPTSSGNNPINVSEVRLNLRVGDPQTFHISVTPQRNLPLDFYILIDISSSMGDELMTVRAISNSIANRIGQVTNNTRLGIGVFNEKLISPFIAEPIDLNIDHSTLYGIIPVPYSFRHIVTLTDNSTLFSDGIASLDATTTNSDFPENGLEALAQVITCEEIIGWRPRGANSVGTRLVLFMTDQEYHYAGEGRLAGILTPYNGACLLERFNDSSPIYEHRRTDEFDYPSVGQISELLSEYDVTTIFAIEEGRIASYEALVDILNVNSFRAASQNFSISSSDADAQAQILDLIESEYRRLLQVVSLDVSEVNSALTLEVQAVCPTDEDDLINQGSACDRVPLTSTVNFTITATLNPGACDSLMDGQTIRNTITSPSFGSFDLEFTVTCNCECATDETPRSETICSGMGVRRCAVCECDDGKCGSDCSLNAGNRTNLDCPRGGVDNERCSGRGRCDCICFCNEGDSLQPGQMIFGDACECDNFRCPSTGTNEVCSGLSRGECCEGSCRCLNSPQGNPYRGLPGNNNCQCEPVEEVCRESVGAELCSGRGTCGCQFCNCESPMHGGKFCELEVIDECLADVDLACLLGCREEYEEPELPDVCPNDCTRTRPFLFVNMADIEEAGSTTLQQEQFLEQTANQRLDQTAGSVGAFRIQRSCEYTDSDMCIISYHMLSNETHFAIIAERRRVCMSTEFSLAVPIYALALIIIGCLIVLGFLLLVLIKIIFLILDYIEVKRWEKDAQTADFSKNTNPLYQSPEMKYENVAYGRE